LARIGRETPLDNFNTFAAAIRAEAKKSLFHLISGESSNKGGQTSPKNTSAKQNYDPSPLTLALTLLRSLELHMETVKALEASQQDLFVAEPLAGPTLLPEQAPWRLGC